ncbi:helix-turn-helix domain-containing protein [Dactylosporangium salmoneum]|uniref:Helix-turn-helix domain-containing protein n=1 Tax=Dactylosporangium salmoneum TaxID=53361 RepID=A0ABN3H5F4_9ACTN
MVDRHTTLARQGSQRRAEQTAAVVERYVEGGQPIRAIAADLGMSYGKVHALLVESATPRRPVGGARTRVQQATAGASPRPTAAPSVRPRVSAC